MVCREIMDLESILMYWSWILGIRQALSIHHQDNIFLKSDADKW